MRTRRILVLVGALAVVLSASAAPAYPGRIDHKFGYYGAAVHADFGGNDLAFAADVQPDGKILMAGQTLDARERSRFAVSRLAKGGSLDRTFSKDGKTTISFGGNYDAAYDVAAAPGGKAVAVGLASNSTLGDSGIVRLTKTGSLDPTFGTGGKLVFDTGGIDFASQVAVQPDGKIVFAAASFVPVPKLPSITDFRFHALPVIVRLLPNGLPDPSFGVAGRFAIPGSAYQSMVSHLQILPDGSISVAGSVWKDEGSPGDLLFARVLPVGSLDPRFGSGGMLVVNGGSDDYLGSATVLRDGRTVAAYGMSAGYGVAKLRADGTLDRSFSGDGKAMVSTPEWAYARGVTVQRDGRIVISGVELSCMSWGGSSFCLPVAKVIRFTARGAVDRSFGSNGSVVNSEMWLAEHVEMQGSRIVVAGWGRGAGGNDFLASAYTSS